MSSIEAVPCSHIRTGVVEVGEQQRVHDEAGPVLDHDGLLAAVDGKGADGVDRVVVGGERPDDLDERHHRRGVEEVDATHPLGTVGGHGQLDDGQGRRVRGQDGVGSHRLAQLGEEPLLDGQVLHDRLDHEVAVGEVGQVRWRSNPGEGGVTVGLVELALVDLLGQRCARGLAIVASTVACSRLRSTTSWLGLRRHLGDAGTHDPGADDRPRALPSCSTWPVCYRPVGVGKRAEGPPQPFIRSSPEGNRTPVPSMP